MKHLQRNNKFDYIIGLHKILIVIEIMLLFFIVYLHYEPDSAIVKSYLTFRYQLEVNEIDNNAYILNISNLCANAKDKVNCVFKAVPYTYNYDRSERTIKNIFSTIFNPLTLTPEEYFKSNGFGVCRDNAVMIKAILDNLNITSVFAFRPNHIYVVAYYNNKTYIINGILQIIDNKTEIGNEYSDLRIIVNRSNGG